MNFGVAGVGSPWSSSGVEGGVCGMWWSIGGAGGLTTGRFPDPLLGPAAEVLVLLAGPADGVWMLVLLGGSGGKVPSDQPGGGVTSGAGEGDFFLGGLGGLGPGGCGGGPGLASSSIGSGPGGGAGGTVLGKAFGAGGGLGLLWLPGPGTSGRE